jgi:CheY-like chemotaxis protein
MIARRTGGAPRILVVDARPAQREMIANALTIAGYDVATATSGASAMDALEWECPDVIVSSAKVQDMDGYELFVQIRKDPATMETPFLLLAGRDRPTALAAAEAGVNIVLTGDVPLDVVVSRVSDLVEGGGDATNAAPIRRIESSGARRPIEPLWAAVEASGTVVPASLQGSLEVMDLPEVTQAISLGAKTGWLTVSLGAGEGAMVFEVGRLVHANFAGKTGEEAFALLIQASHRERRAGFRFSQAQRAELGRVPRTIARGVDQLLLSIAAGIDEGGTSGAPIQPVELTNHREG